MISDVGIECQFLETEKSITCLAPEVIEDLTNRTKQADIYSNGIVLRKCGTASRRSQNSCLSADSHSEKWLQAIVQKWIGIISTFREYLMSWWNAG